MKLLHVLPSLDQRYGGPLRAVLDLSAHSQSDAFSSEIVGLGPVSIADNPMASGRIHSIPSSFPKAFAYSRELSPWLRAHLPEYDGVILHGMWLYPTLSVARACRAFGKPYIFFPHGMLEPWSIFGQGSVKAAKKFIYWHLIEKQIMRHSTAALFTTNRELELARKTFSLPSVPLLVIPYGVAVSKKEDQQPDQSLLFPSEENVVLFLGRVHPKKNPDFLLEAWAAAGVGRTWRLVIAGPCESSYMERLRQLVRFLGIESHVTFVPMVSGANKTYLLRRAKWFVLPSSQENFGNAVLEAIIHGCPTVLSDQVYFSEFCRGASEVLPLKKEAWVEFFRHRMLDESARTQMIQGQKHVREEFEIRNLAHRWAVKLGEIFSESKSVANV